MMIRKTVIYNITVGCKSAADHFYQNKADWIYFVCYVVELKYVTDNQNIVSKVGSIPPRYIIMILETEKHCL